MDDPVDEELLAWRIRQLFRGRFSQEEIIRCIRHFGDGDNVVAFLMEEKHDVVNQLLGRGTGYIESTRVESENLSPILRVAKEGSEMHQFACKTCERSWWKSVPCKNPVSKCYKCRGRFEPIPRDREWGIGMFQCGNEDCQRTFHGFATMTMTKSFCYRCKRRIVPVVKICPPVPMEKRERKKSHHFCNGVNCFSPNPPEETLEMTAEQKGEWWKRNAGKRVLPGGCLNERGKPAICIHPKSNPAKNVRVRTWSSKALLSADDTLTSWLDRCSFSQGMFTLSYSLISGCSY